MNVDKWTRCGHCVNWALDGSCDCIIVQVGFWIEIPFQMRLCPIFFKIMDPGKWGTTVWYQVTRYPHAFRGLIGDQRIHEFWGIRASYQSLGIRLGRITAWYHSVIPAWYQSLGMQLPRLDGHGFRLLHSLCISCFVP